MLKTLFFWLSFMIPLHFYGQAIQHIEVKYATNLLAHSEIAYSNKPITWKDFLGRPEKNISNVAMTYSGIKMRYEIKKENGKVTATILLCPYMDIDESWVKPEGKKESILTHEQRHFDIAGIVAQELYDTLLKTHFEVSTFQQTLTKLHQEYVEHLNKLQVEYDNETEHGTNKEAQITWNQKISEEIKKYFDKSN